MARILKCKICGEKFDIQSIPGVKLKERVYAHLDCAEKTCTPYIEKVPLSDSDFADPDFVKIKDTVQDLLGDKANWPWIVKEIKTLKVQNNFTFSGMYQTLRYYYYIKKYKVPPNNNVLGIIKKWYLVAKNYYYELYLIEQEAKKLEEQKTETIEKEIEIPIPTYQKKEKLFDFGGEE